MREVLSKTVAAVLLLIALWVGLSIAEVHGQNTKPNPSYNRYNFFVVSQSIIEDINGGTGAPTK